MPLYRFAFKVLSYLKFQNILHVLRGVLQQFSKHRSTVTNLFELSYLRNRNSQYHRQADDIFTNLIRFGKPLTITRSIILSGILKQPSKTDKFTIGT